MKKRLPLFPLPDVVLFPGMTLPLHIFEERYKVMLADVMGTEARFGILLCQEYNPTTLEGSPFDVGTVAEVMECERLEEGRMNILVVGTERFRVTAYYPEEQPYLTGQVDYLPESPDENITVMLKTETADLFQEALRLTHKVLKKDYTPLVLPEEVSALSFAIAENLRGSLVLKQKLLEIDSPKERLEYEKEVLENMVKTLAVRAQIEDVFRQAEH